MSDELLRKALDHPGSLDWSGPGHPWPNEVAELWREAARRWSEFPTDEDVEVAMVAMTDTKAGFDPPHFGMDELVRAALEAVRARETGETPQ